MRGWVESLAASKSPDGAPDFDDSPDHLLRIGAFDVLWATEATFTLRMIVDVHPDRPAEPLTFAANFTREAVPAWRYCRNDHHLDLDISRDHLHVHGNKRLVGLPDPLTLDQLTSRLAGRTSIILQGLGMRAVGADPSRRETMRIQAASAVVTELSASECRPCRSVRRYSLGSQGPAAVPRRWSCPWQWPVRRPCRHGRRQCWP